MPSEEKGSEFSSDPQSAGQTRRSFTRRGIVGAAFAGAAGFLVPSIARARESATTERVGEETSEGPVTRGPQLESHKRDERVHANAKNLAKRDSPNTLRGQQTIKPPATSDAIRIEVPHGFEGRQIVTTRMKGDRNPTLEEVSWVDGGGIWHFSHQQFGSPNGPGAEHGRSDLPAAADHVHTYYPALFAASGERSWECYRLDGGVYEDMGPTPGEDGRMIHGSFLAQVGEAITSATLFSGGTPMQGCRHIWLGLYNYGDHPPYLWLMSQTPDEPGSSWPANTARTFTFPEAIRTQWSETAWFMSLMIDADTHPSLMGYVQHPSLLSDPVVAPWGKATGLTDTAPDIDEEDFERAPIKRFYFTVVTRR